MSFLKFQGKQNGQDRGNIHWQRASRDGAPFRGSNAPIIREEEFEEFAERVWDSKYGTFDTSNPDERHCGRTYQEILDGIKIDWFQLLGERQYQWGKNKDGRPVMYVFIEWGEPYLELPPDKARTMSAGVTKVEDEARYDRVIHDSEGQPRLLRGSQNGGGSSGSFVL